MQDFTKKGEQDAVRCDTRAELIKKGCKENEIISPENKRNIAKDDPLSASQNGQVVQMRPQKIDLDLRPGQWNRLMLPTILSECQAWFLTDSLQAESAYKNCMNSLYHNNLNYVSVYITGAYVCCVLYVLFTVHISFYCMCGGGVALVLPLFISFF